MAALHSLDTTCAYHWTLPVHAERRTSLQLCALYFQNQRIESAKLREKNLSGSGIQKPEYLSKDKKIQLSADEMVIHALDKSTLKELVAAPNQPDR